MCFIGDPSPFFSVDVVGADLPVVFSRSRRESPIKTVWRLLDGDEDDDANGDTLLGRAGSLPFSPTERLAVAAARLEASSNSNDKVVPNFSRAGLCVSSNVFSERSLYTPWISSSSRKAATDSFSRRL